MNAIKDIIWRLIRDLAEALNAWTVDVPRIDFNYNFIVLAFYDRNNELIIDYGLYIKDLIKITDDVAYTKLLYSLIYKHYE